MTHAVASGSGELPSAQPPRAWGFSSVAPGKQLRGTVHELEAGRPLGPQSRAQAGQHPGGPPHPQDS